MWKQKLAAPSCEWALDSGGYSALSKTGSWPVSEAHYLAEIKRWRGGIGRLAWVAPMDWMCEPNVLMKTGKTVAEHQRLTVLSYLQLREHLGSLVIPVLQGWTIDDYLRCMELYAFAGVDLTAELTVGVGSICRRGQDAVIGRILRRVARENIPIHAFGVRGDSLIAHASILASADSMAWSYRARAARQGPNAGYEKTWNWCCESRQLQSRCTSCLAYALRWRQKLLARRNQLVLEGVA